MIRKKKVVPQQPKIQSFEITLEIETGNLIHRKFDTREELLDFINEYARNPKKIREEISPKKRTKKIGKQMGFYKDIVDDNEW